MTEPVTLREHIEYRLNCLQEEVAGLHKAIDSLNATRAELAGKADRTSVLIAYVISGVSLILAVLNMIGRNP